MTQVAPRSPDQVMRLDRLGASHPTRLSFLRAMLRQAFSEGWRYGVQEWHLDRQGFGHAVLRIDTPRRPYALVCFSRPLRDEDRSDRVIATAWDASFVLYDGIPDAAEIQRLAGEAPRQEAGRFRETDLILCRANKSVRIFEHVVDRLSQGRQPDAAILRDVGYLMRTTAVYGNGKFGIADRDGIADRSEFAGPFRAEMLAVWLVRAFTVALAEHVAAQRNPAAACRLDHALRRSLGVGNATGLGMAPFLVRHPLLVHRWFAAREEALARVRNLDRAEPESLDGFAAALAAMAASAEGWRTDDAVQAPRIARLRAELALLDGAWRALATGPRPWDGIYRFAEAHFSLEGQEAVVSLLLEPHGRLVDDLADAMAADESEGQAIDGSLRCGDLRRLADRAYGWCGAIDGSDPDAEARFWYVSEEKLEPRLGQRAQEDGAERELPLAVWRDVNALLAALDGCDPAAPISDLLARHPALRLVTRRVLLAATHAYAEIRDNLVGAAMRPVDLLRAKLAFFGAGRFDPRSDRWLRITLFGDRPFPDELQPVVGSDAQASRPTEVVA